MFDTVSPFLHSWNYLQEPATILSGDEHGSSTVADTGLEAQGDIRLDRADHHRWEAFAIQLPQGGSELFGFAFHGTRRSDVSPLDHVMGSIASRLDTSKELGHFEH